MSISRSPRHPLDFPKQFLILLTLFVALSFPARPDFWSLVGKGQPDTVKLVRKLPPVSARNGNTVKFEPEIAGNSIPPETATILREKIRTLLLNAKAGGIQLVDGPADTTIKCIVTGYEPKIVHPGERKVGLKSQKIQTWIGNIGASVQVLDNHNRPIDAANLKFHLENDFVISEQEDKVAGVQDKKTSWKDKLASGVKMARGGADAGDLASAAGGGQQMHDALGAGGKGGRAPTEGEWRDALIEGLAAKVANRIVTVDQEFVAVLPVDKEFLQIREVAKAGRWGEVQEQTEKMSPLSGTNEAYRLYLIGLSYEAIAYGEADKSNEAAETLNKASKFYSDAKNVKPAEHEILLAQIRAQDSLDHYLEIQHFLQNRPKNPAPDAPVTEVKTSPAAPAPGVAPGTAPGSTPPAENAANNAALVDMVKEGLPESVMITFVQTASEPKFDVSANGLMQLARAKVPSAVITAVQKQMTAKPAAPAPAHRPQTATKPVAPAKPVP